MSEDPPKLHVDSDWKAEAQAEKERLAADTAGPVRSPERPGRPVPRGSFHPPTSSR